MLAARGIRVRQRSSDLIAEGIIRRGWDVAYLPNPNGKGMVLVLGGLWMSGTQSAENFVLDGTRFSDWLQSIANPDGTIPSFEVLISTRSLESSATDSSIIAKRIHTR